MATDSGVSIEMYLILITCISYLTVYMPCVRNTYTEYDAIEYDADMEFESKRDLSMDFKCKKQTFK